MLDDTLSNIFSSQWSVFFIVTLLLLVFAEIGYRLGSVFQRSNAEAAKNRSGNVLGAVLGLLGLLLGFSFAMSVGRYDVRRSLIVEESNSIGTTWLRAGFLPAPHAKEIRKLLEDYTRLRVERFAKADDPASITAVHADVARIHSALWAQGEAAAKEQPTPITASFITSLNETIDLDATRVAALRNHVPGVVWLLLLVVAGCGAWASGYGSGTEGLRSAFSQYIFPVLIGVVITLIVDIDRPNKGLIGVSQKPLQDLLESFGN